MTTEFFQVRKLLWHELTLSVRASEEEELRSAIGSRLIDGNEELRQELVVLAEILAEFQQQNDDIRDALAGRPHIPEPPGRPLLIKKLKLLVADMHEHTSIRSTKDAELLDYVRTVSEIPDTRCNQHLLAPVHRRLNLDEIDAIKEDLREALNDERQLILEDIDFIQGCLEMEKDLIDDDRRKIASAKPPPSLNDLNAFRKTLEKTLEDQEAMGAMEGIFKKANSSSSFARTRMLPVPPSQPPGCAPALRRESPISQPVLSSLDSSLPSLTSSQTRVLKIRHIVQESRDEPFLS